jgi:hypothetical protein
MLYEAKENGRNRCEVSTDVSQATPQVIQESDEEKELSA